jgi:hypothetical protein
MPSNWLYILFVLILWPLRRKLFYLSTEVAVCEALELKGLGVIDLSHKCFRQIPFPSSRFFSSLSLLIALNLLEEVANSFINI